MNMNPWQYAVGLPERLLDEKGGALGVASGRLVDLGTIRMDSADGTVAGKLVCSKWVALNYKDHVCWPRRLIEDVTRGYRKAHVVASDPRKIIFDANYYSDRVTQMVMQRVGLGFVVGLRDEFGL